MLHTVVSILAQLQLGLASRLLCCSSETKHAASTLQAILGLVLNCCARSFRLVSSGQLSASCLSRFAGPSYRRHLPSASSAMWVIKAAMAATDHSPSVYRSQILLFLESFRSFFAFHYCSQKLQLCPRFSLDGSSG